MLISAGARFAVVLADDGQDYVCDPPSPAVRVGDRVTFEAVSGERSEGNRRPLAYGVERA